ncbi:MAG: O-antigen ligase family protein [Eubacterium sp.]|nr:O-antigen ligase family protein [Eubacterium sp.]
MKIKLSSDDRISLLLVAFISCDVWLSSLNNIINLSILGNGLATYLCLLLYAAIIACALRVVWKRLNYTDVLVLMAIAVVVIGSYLLFPDTHQRMSERIVYFFQALPWLFVGRCVTDYHSVLSWFEKAAKVTVVLGVLYYIVLIIHADVNSDNAMVFAYNYLPSYIIVSYDLTKNVNIKNIIFTAAGAGVLVLCGCRGAILCYGVAMLIFVYFFAGKRWYKIAATLVIAAAVMLLMSNYFYMLMVSFNRQIQALGIDSRIFRQILSDELSDGSGRGAIAQQVLQGIAENPFFGYGLYGDTTLNMWGTYSHNIILELMASFGVPLGITLFLVFTVSFWRVITSKRSPIEYKIILITFFCAGFVKLFMSGSFMHEPCLCLLIGMMAGNKKVFIQSENTNLFTDKKSVLIKTRDLL